MPDEQRGKRIAQARRELQVLLERDVSQRDMARALGVDASTFWTWESGEKVPRSETLERLCRLLRVQPGYLLFGQPPKEAPTPIAEIRKALEPPAVKKSGAAKKVPLTKPVRGFVPRKKGGEG